MSDRSYDAVVIGAGPAGEVAVSRLHDQGLEVALVERELVGGECAYWACIPSKTLLRAPEVRAEAARVAGVSEPSIDWGEVRRYRDYMIRGLDDTAQVEGYRRQGVDVYKGDGRILGRGKVAVGDRVLDTSRIVLATGSDARIPAIDGLSDVGFWTNREATTLTEIPESIVILGGGPVGIELAQFLRRLGSRVVLLQGAERLLDRESPAVSELIERTLREDGIDVRLGAHASRVTREQEERVLHLSDGDRVAGRALLIAVGRAPRVHGIGLESVGIDPRAEGIEVDERCRAGEGVWAIGDVTGVMPFTHVGMYQARIVAGDIAGEKPRADYSAIPRVVFSDPEIAAVGVTERQAHERGIEVATSRIALADAIARPWTYEREPGGELGLIADRRQRALIGAWAVAPMAGEWIHYAALAIKTQTPISVLLDTVAQFPTFTEAYLKAVEGLEV